MSTPIPGTACLFSMSSSDVVALPSMEVTMVYGASPALDDGDSPTTPTMRAPSLAGTAADIITPEKSASVMSANMMLLAGPAANTFDLFLRVVSSSCLLSGSTKAPMGKTMNSSPREVIFILPMRVIMPWENSWTIIATASPRIP